MRHRLRVWLPLGALSIAAAIALTAAGLEAAEPVPPIVQRQSYHRDREVIERTQAMVYDPTAQQLAEARGLNILNVTWEDTGRFYGSAVGPNISDITIQVQQQDPDTGQYQLHLMPVIRHPNFADLSADIPLDTFFVLVGNEAGEDLRRCPWPKYWAICAATCTPQTPGPGGPSRCWPQAAIVMCWSVPRPAFYPCPRRV